MDFKILGNGIIEIYSKGEKQINIDEIFLIEHNCNELHIKDGLPYSEIRINCLNWEDQKLFENLQIIVEDIKCESFYLENIGIKGIFFSTYCKIFKLQINKVKFALFKHNTENVIYNEIDYSLDISSKHICLVNLYDIICDSTFILSDSSAISIHNLDKNLDNNYGELTLKGQNSNVDEIQLSNVFLNVIKINNNVIGKLNIYYSQYKDFRDIIDISLFNNSISYLQLNGAQGNIKTKINLKEYGEKSGKNNIFYCSIFEFDGIKFLSIDPTILTIKNVKLAENAVFILDGFESRIRRLILNGFFNNSQFIVIGNINLEDFKVKNSDLGELTFNSISFEKLFLLNSNISNLNVNGARFPEEIKIFDNNILNKDNYRQLKFLMDKSGNHTEANKFFAKEMEYHGKTLTKTSDRILFWLGKNISDFGNDWLRVIWILLSFTLIVSIFNFGYNITCLGNWFGSCISLNQVNYEDYFRAFLNLIYPLYGLRKEYIESLDNWLLLGFILYKFIYAYLAYSLIVAFKRTTKR